MPQEPFTSTGVQQKQSELYQLPDSQLAAQADQIKADLRTWLKNNFTMSAEQQTYLDNMDDQFISYAACQTSLAVNNRLPVTLNFMGSHSQGKLVRTSNSIVCDNSAQQGFSATGSLAFEIIYQ